MFQSRLWRAVPPLTRGSHTGHSTLLISSSAPCLRHLSARAHNAKQPQSASKVEQSEADVSPATARAIRFLADTRFHQSLWLPSNPGDGRPSPLRVTYSDIGDPEGEPLLVCGGLYSSRYTLAQADELARKRRVRLITPDKPGIGGTPPVDIDKKVKTWMDIVQSLTHHLHLKHISLLGHSSGTIYILNTLLQLRHLLHPTHPYAALFTPWVHPAHSGATAPSIASAVPDWVIGKWYGASHLLSQYSIAIMLGPSAARPGVKMDTDEGTKAIDEKILEYALLENVEGISQEALFCLKRGGEGAWGPWREYDEFIPLLRRQEMEGERRGRIELDVFFAEEDHSSGEEGSRWFDELWRSETESCWIRYESQIVPGTTHETVMKAGSGALERVFERVTT